VPQPPFVPHVAEGPNRKQVIAAIVMGLITAFFIYTGVSWTELLGLLAFLPAVFFAVIFLLILHRIIRAYRRT